MKQSYKTSMNFSHNLHDFYCKPFKLPPNSKSFDSIHSQIFLQLLHLFQNPPLSLHRNFYLPNVATSSKFDDTFFLVQFSLTILQIATKQNPRQAERNPHDSPKYHSNVNFNPQKAISQ
jgi:hypothetical protein